MVCTSTPPSSEVRGKRMAQGVDAAGLGDAGAVLGGIEDALRAVRIHRMIGYPRAGKQPQRRAVCDPVSAQLFEQARAKSSV